MERGWICLKNEEPINLNYVKRFKVAESGINFWFVDEEKPVFVELYDPAEATRICYLIYKAIENFNGAIRL